MASHNNQELERARVLLSSKRARVTLQEIAPIRPAKEIGAVDGIGFKAEDPDAYASVYVFESHSQMAAAVTKLKASIPTEGMRVLDARNGLLLFIGYTRIDGPQGIDAKFRLSDMISAFSGDE